MVRSRTSLLAVAAATCVLAAGVSTTPAGAAPSSDGTDRADVPTFKEFAASTFRDFDGQYIVNGDDAIKNRDALRAYYDRMVGTDDGSTHENGLVVNAVFGSDDL